jgi:hypothetical protein
MELPLGSPARSSIAAFLFLNAVRFSMVTAIIAAPTADAQSPCPPVGADTACGVVLTIQDIGNGRGTCSSTNCVAISNNQGPYDDIEDTLVGVVNSSKKLPISSLVLTSSDDIFGFDGDGICGLSPNTGQPYVPGVACTWAHPTTYEGPVMNAAGVIVGAVVFSDYSSTTTGTVNFKPPIPPGGTAYFSLENSLTAATACSSVINNSVHHALINGGKGITALFTSNTNLSYTLASAASLCGFTGWEWQQTITSQPCPGFHEAGSTSDLFAPPSFNDPPPKGYSYQNPPNAVGIPVYWNPYTPKGTVTNPAGQLLSLADHESTYTMDFSDGPNAGCLSGSTNGTGKKVNFTTHLVGLIGPSSGYSVQDTGIGFSYFTTFNGTSGGIHVLNSTLPPDPGSGTGGITVTMANGITSYQYPKSFGVSEINGHSVSVSSPAPPMLLGTTIKTTSSGLAYSRVTQTFNGTVTITNASSSTIDGPFQVVLDSLTEGVTLTNATSTFGGWSFITVPAVGSLAPGQSAPVSVVFSNPSNVTIDFAPVVYSGTFN